jgi:hypothetical protein
LPKKALLKKEKDEKSGLEMGDRGWGIGEETFRRVSQKAEIASM